ncbi:MAG: hypothetical protein RBR16_13565 [Syntrophus sp. (in: bacteria)]|jgi:regulator of replication initiation timing|nr:hypothetical protein [Syntrophus sp. (in: bacteria)]
MTIFDEIENFLNEHGASSKLKDHVAFVKEQMAVLIRENTMLKSKLSMRIAESNVLEAQIRDLKDEKGDKEER